jgi:hypothetical protein
MQRYIDQKGISLLDKESQYVFTNGKFQLIPAGASVTSSVRAPVVQQSACCALSVPDSVPQLHTILMQETYYGYSRFQEATYKRELQNGA